ncbi:hypothetical protein ACJ72_08352 [Emergomyces africanus]|uniref:Copper-fist domain-containing protein n=1 Tax=Emergomyces africanus TaxID=1955775 RepID=A0A1B7NKQ7_9EURO|nr:hypothetical protein ACJ72_08352 [Emergomyces africanus]
MPLDEEGAKWSCEPCVRGHRSSKCQHFDRLMMKVPKAGRPLAKCPHPKGTCSCQKLYAFMVRIPKGSTCLCRPLYQVPMVVTEAARPLAQPAAPGLRSPVAPSFCNRNRIQKRPRRQNSLQAGPELDAKSLNTRDLPPNGYKADMGHVPNPSPSNVQSLFGEQYLQPISTPTEYTHNQSPNGGFNVQGVYPAPPHSGTELQSPTNGGCCSAQTPAESASEQQPQSCCSTKSSKPRELNGTTPRLKQEEPSPSQHSSPLAPHRRPTWEHRPFSTIGIESYAHDPNVTLHMPHSNSLANLNFHEPSSAPATGYSSPNTSRPHRSMTDPMGNFTPSRIHNTGFQPNQVPNGPQQQHNCDCGDKCQCLGCASHPFNSTTRQHVQQMGYMMTSRGDDQGSETTDTTTCRTSYDSPAASAEFDYDDGWPSNNVLFHSSGQAHWNGQHSAPAPGNHRSPSTAAAVYDHNQGQMLMQPAAYYELEYPVGLLDQCTNMTGTCQCGANCSCVGCLTHNGHDGISLDISTARDSRAGGRHPIPETTAHPVPA